MRLPAFHPLCQQTGRGLEKLPLLDCIEISSEPRSHGQAGGDGVVPGSHDVMTNKYLVTLTGYYDGWKLPDNEFMCEVCEKKTVESSPAWGAARNYREITSQYFSNIDLFGPRTPARHSRTANNLRHE